LYSSKYLDNRHAFFLVLKSIEITLKFNVVPKVLVILK